MQAKRKGHVVPHKDVDHLHPKASPDLVLGTPLF